MSIVNWGKYGKCLLVAICGAAFRFLYYLGSWGCVELSELILSVSWSDYIPVPAYVMEFFSKFLPFMAFQLIFGQTICSHFQDTGVYYFSRCTNRICWFGRESLRLLLLTVEFMMFFFAAGILLASLRNEIVVNQEAVLLLSVTILIDILWLYAFTLLINVLSVQMGSVWGSVLVIIVQAVCVLWLTMETDLMWVDSSMSALAAWQRIWWNPVMHLLIGMHSSVIEGVDALLPTKLFDYDLYQSVFYLLVLCVLIWLSGAWLIKRQEILSDQGKEY